MKLPENLRWAESPSRVVGSNVRRLRKQADVTLEVLSKEAKRHGLKWSGGRVADFEGGRVDVTVDTLLAVAQALANVTGQPVTLADLLAFDGPGLDVNGRTVPNADKLFRGEPLQPVADEKATPTELVKRNGFADLADASEKLGVPKQKVAALLLAREDAGLVDRRAARSLGVPLDELTRQSVLLWGRSFSAQRDKVAGPDAHAARLGEVTRELRQQVQEQLDAD